MSDKEKEEAEVSAPNPANGLEDCIVSLKVVQPFFGGLNILLQAAKLTHRLLKREKKRKRSTNLGMRKRDPRSRRSRMKRKVRSLEATNLSP